MELYSVLNQNLEFKMCNAGIHFCIILVHESGFLLQLYWDSRYYVGTPARLRKRCSLYGWHDTSRKVYN